MAKKKKKSYLAFTIIAVVLIAAVAAGVFLFQARRTPPGLQVASTSKSGAQPPHVRGDPGFVGQPRRLPPKAGEAPVLQFRRAEYGATFRDVNRKRSGEDFTKNWSAFSIPMLIRRRG
jgi:hypothetical protein